MGPPVLALARALRKMWGNPKFSASGEYLLRLCHEADRCPHTVVECGSGLTTLVLAQAVPAERLLVLEHDAHWYNRVKLATNLNGSIVNAPLVSRGDYDWYELPDMGDRKVGLVVCDGPHVLTPGGRFGALPELAPHLAPEFTILLDDTQRQQERDVLDRWRGMGDLDVEFVGDGDKEFAVIRGRA